MILTYPVNDKMLMMSGFQMDVTHFTLFSSSEQICTKTSCWWH